LPGRRYAALHPGRPAAARTTILTYYFDMKDGVRRQGRTGLEFAATRGAIEQSLPVGSGRDPRITDYSLSLIVTDESGKAVLREPVHPDTFPKPPNFSARRASAADLKFPCPARQARSGFRSKVELESYTCWHLCFPKFAHGMRLIRIQTIAVGSRGEVLSLVPPPANVAAASRILPN
jgi:hypothetical protein